MECFFLLLESTIIEQGTKERKHKKEKCKGTLCDSVLQKIKELEY